MNRRHFLRSVIAAASLAAGMATGLMPRREEETVVSLVPGRIKIDGQLMRRWEGEGGLRDDLLVAALRHAEEVNRPPISAMYAREDWLDRAGF